MNTKRHIAAFLAVLLAVCMMIPAVPAQMATVRLGKSKLTLKVGDTYTLKLSGVAKKNRSRIKWSSADKRIVAVKAASSNISAKLTAKKVGKTTIKAKFAGKSYACKVVVKKATSESEQIPGSLSHD
nr:Ig-like domain-containing protein [Eubacterium sp.]